MKNTLNELKTKFDNSGVNAPELLDEAFVLRQLDGVEPLRVEEKRRRGTFKTAVIAASIAAVIAGSAAAFFTMNAINTPVSPEQKQSETTAPKKIDSTVDKETVTVKYKTHEDIRQALGDLHARDDRYSDSDGVNPGAEQIAGSSSGSSGGSGGLSEKSFGGTYLQEENVDEGDIVKTDGKNIYCANGSVVTIYNADTKETSTLEVTDDAKVKRDHTFAHLTVSELLIRGNKLMVICESGYTEKGYNYSLEYYTTALVYDVSDTENITLLDMSAQSGSFVSSRMTGSMLYVVSLSDPTDCEDDSCLPRVSSGGELSLLPADKVYGLENAERCTMTLCSALDTADHNSKADCLAFIGSSQEVYCSEKNLYLTGDSDGYNFSTRIIKLSLGKKLSLAAGGSVDGTILDRYWMSEKDGKLRVVSRDTHNSSFAACTKLTVLDENLREIGSLDGIASNESCEAVRYVGDTAYIITYRSIDPLFVVSLKNPAKPKLLGNVEISGFSSMLVPVDDKTLLGIGCAEDDETGTSYSLKLALFDVSDPLEPKVLDSEKLDEYSEAMSDPRALLYNPDRDDYVVPLNNMNAAYSGGGMLNFKVENGKLKLLKKHTATLPTARCVYIGNTVYLISDLFYSGFKVDSVKYG